MTNETPTSNGFALPTQAYKILKFVALILLPALSVLYVAVAGFWNLPKAVEVVGTITAIDLFLGALLGISTSNYNKGSQDGTLVFNNSDPNKDSYSFEVTKPLSELENQDTITLKVRNDS